MEGVYGLAELIVAKQRHGSTGKVRMRFEARITRFSDLADECDGGHDTVMIEDIKKTFIINTMFMHYFLDLLTALRPSSLRIPEFPALECPMARVTVEDCVDKIPNRFDLVLIAAQRAREISGGAELTIDRDRDKNPVVALREIAEETVGPDLLKETLVGSLQRVLPDDDDEVDDIGSLSQQAEALRITAAAPVRNTSLGGDYDG